MPHPHQRSRGEGQTVPDVSLRMLGEDQWRTVSTDDLFAGKHFVLFSLPGAFTPTCSSNHLPRYNELAANFRKAGIDSIVCLALNDAMHRIAGGRGQQHEHRASRRVDAWARPPPAVRERSAQRTRRCSQ